MAIGGGHQAIQETAYGVFRYLFLSLTRNEGGSPEEVLMKDVPLIIETQVPRTEIDNVRIGQKATVRLTALNLRTTPVLNGEVFYVSADALPDRGGDARQARAGVGNLMPAPASVPRVPASA
jgi:HlyD family secretion protein